MLSIPVPDASAASPARRLGLQTGSSRFRWRKTGMANIREVVGSSRVGSRGYGEVCFPADRPGTVIF